MDDHHPRPRRRRRRAARAGRARPSCTPRRVGGGEASGACHSAILRRDSSEWPRSHDASRPYRDSDDPSRARPSTRSAAASTQRGHLEVGGCDVVELAARVRHARLHLRRGRHPRPRPRLPRGLRAPAATTSRSLYASKAAPFTAAYRRLPRGGALGRRRLRRRAAHGAARPASTRRGSTCTATTRPSAELRWRSRPGSATSSSTPSPRSSASTRSARPRRRRC